MIDADEPARRAGGSGTFRRAAQLLGAVISGATALLWLGVLWLPSEREVLGHFGVVGAAVMLFIAILGVIAALRGHGNFMLAMFLAAFLPVGAFMLWTTAPMYRLLGLLNLGYLVTAFIVRAKSRSADDSFTPAGSGESR